MMLTFVPSCVHAMESARNVVALVRTTAIPEAAPVDVFTSTGCPAVASPA